MDMDQQHSRRRPLTDLHPNSRHRGSRDAVGYGPRSRRWTPALLVGLNADQMVLARTLDGPVLALAGPGTGKTETITKRMAWAVEAGHTPPHAILATTFTTDAAQEMRGRVAQLVGDGAAHAMTITTLNALGYAILRRDQDLLGFRNLGVSLSTATEILDGLIDGLALPTEEDELIDTNVVVERIAAFKTLGIAPDAAGQAWPTVAARISGHAAPDAPIDASDEAAAAVIEARRDHLTWSVAARVYGDYCDAMRDCDAIDYADQCSLAVRLLREHPGVRSHWRSKYQLIMVDEFQDTDPAQWEMIRLIAGEGDAANVCCIGDDDQTLYPWRLAEVSHILDFETWYPTVRVVTLATNYRCGAAIIAAAGRLIAHNTARRPKTQSPAPGNSPGEIVTLSAETRQGLAVQFARDMLSRGPARRMLLARSNRAAQIAAGVLAGHGIAIAHTTPLVSEPLATALAAARLALDADDFSATLTVAARMPGIDPNLLERARRRRGRGNAIDRLVEEAAGETERSALEALRTAIAALADADAEVGNVGSGPDVAQRLAVFWETTGMQHRKVPMGRTPDGRAVLSGARGKTCLRGWLEAVDDCLTLRDDGVRVMTMHGSKGLQEDDVYLFDLTADAFPADTATPTQIEDERRIAFVGLTRARRRAVLGHRALPSRFVLEALTGPPLDGAATAPEPTASATLGGRATDSGANGSPTAVAAPVDTTIADLVLALRGGQGGGAA